MPDSPAQRASLGLPTEVPPRPAAKEPGDPSSEPGDAVASTSASLRDDGSVDSSSHSVTLAQDLQSPAFSHYSVSTLLGLTGARPKPSASSDKPKGLLARSLLKMLLGSQKAPESQKADEVAPDQFTDVHNLVPYGDVVGLLGVTVKHCKDFTAKFNVKHDINLLIRISIDKIMKCTNPQVYKAHYTNRKNIAIYFGDVRYFSVKVPKQSSDPRNRIVLELVGFEGPGEFPRLFGKVSMHLYEVIQKQSFTATCAMRIRNMVFCTVDAEFMFCYGCFGYGYSHQLRLPGTDPAQSVAYSMFLRVPPPQDRKDPIRNAILPQHMDYPAVLSPDLCVTGGNFELEPPAKITEEYKKLQKALQVPPQERLERLKQEYRSLKTWNEKADYLDQLILKRGPKVAPGQTKLSRFKELVQKIQSAAPRDSIALDTGETLIDEIKPDEVEKSESAPEDVDGLALLNAKLAQPEPPQEEAEESDAELRKVQDLIESTETYQPVPTLTITSSATSSPESSDGAENLLGKIVREVHHESETSLSSSGVITETGDSESPVSEGRLVDEEPLVTPRKKSIAEYPPEQMQERSSENIYGSVSDSGAETQEEWPWKAAEFQEAVFSGSKFEPFLRHIGRIPAPFPGKAQEVESGTSEETPSCTDIKEQEDQDPPYEMTLAEMHTSPSDTKLAKPGEQLSILRLIETNMECCEEEQQFPQQNDKEPKPVKMDFIQKPSKEKPSEVSKMDNFFRKNLEDVLVDRLVKVVALKSLLSKNLENLVSEKLLKTEMSQELKDPSLLNAVESLLGEREKRLLKDIKLGSREKPDIKNLKDIMALHLQAQLIGKLFEQQIIPDIGLTGNDQKVSFPSCGDLVKRSKDLSKERITEITLKPLSQTVDSFKTESMQDSEEGQSVIRKTDLSEGKMDVGKSALPLKSHSSLKETINAETDLNSVSSKNSLEIIRVLLPLSTETELAQDKMEMCSKSSNDILIEKRLKQEVLSLKSCLSKRFQGRLKDQFKDQLPETGLRTKKDTKTVSVCGENKMALEKDLPDRRQVSAKENLAEVLATKEMPVLSGNIQNIVLEALSENDIVSLNSILSEKTQDNLLERLSNIGLITEKELEKIAENLSVMAKETQPKEVKGSDVPEEGQIPSAESLQDRFTEEELENLKSLLSRLLNEGAKEGLSESEVQGLTSILEKSFEDLPIQNSAETGISKVVEIKDECHSIPLPSLEESTSTVASVDVSDRGKHRSKENKISSAGEKRRSRGENTDFPEYGIFEVETSNKETQTSDTLLPLKKVKHPCKKEGHRLQNSPDKPIPDMPSSKKGVESISKSKPPEDAFKRMSEYTSSSFLSVHDIGIQTETKDLSKPPNYFPKPSFPVNPQTFLLLHSDPKEETKSSNKSHQKPSKKKSDKSLKKDMVSCYQSAIANPQIRKEVVSSSKEILKGRKHPESPSKHSVTESRKDSKVSLSGGTRKESVKHKSEKKQSKEISSKKSLSKTYTLPDLQQQDPPLTEKSSTSKCSASGSTKGSTENPGDDADLESFKHLEKAIERALHDLGRAPGESPSQTSYSSRPHTTPSAAVLSKDSGRSFSTNNSAAGNPRDITSSVVSQMLENQVQLSTMTPEQLDEVLRTLRAILRP